MVRRDATEVNVLSCWFMQFIPGVHNFADDLRSITKNMFFLICYKQIITRPLLLPLVYGHFVL